MADCRGEGKGRKSRMGPKKEQGNMEWKARKKKIKGKKRTPGENATKLEPGNHEKSAKIKGITSLRPPKTQRNNIGAHYSRLGKGKGRRTVTSS